MAFFGIVPSPNTLYPNYDTHTYPFKTFPIARPGGSTAACMLHTSLFYPALTLFSCSWQQRAERHRKARRILAEAVVAATRRQTPTKHWSQKKVAKLCGERETILVHQYASLVSSKPRVGWSAKSVSYLCSLQDRRVYVLFDAGIDGNTSVAIVGIARVSGLFKPCVTSARRNSRHYHAAPLPRAPGSRRHMPCTLPVSKPTGERRTRKQAGWPIQRSSVLFKAEVGVIILRLNL